MNECKPVMNTGLRGFTVASTRISDVVGEEGKLIYRGYLINDLAGRASFEETAYLLLYEKLPGTSELDTFKSLLAEETHVPAQIIKAFEFFPKNALPMDVLQAGVSMLAVHDSDVKDSSREAASRMAIRLIAKLPVLLAGWARIRAEKKPVDPAPGLGHAANFLYMFNGEKPDDENISFFDTALVLHAEHSFNASTFAAREVASTRAHMYAAITAAIGALSGELHGGANTRVMEMLLEIGSPANVDNYLHRLLESGGKIMGLGHAVYKTDDPRARILAPMAKRMGERAGDTRWYDLSELLEKMGKRIFKQKKGIDIYVNVDFYSASLYYSMGIPVDLFTPLFAISRVAGWTAHVIEELFAGAAEKPVLYRPESEYVGDYCGAGECAFVPLEERGLG